MATTATKAFLASTTRSTQEQGPAERCGIRWEAWSAGEKRFVLDLAQKMLRIGTNEKELMSSPGSVGMLGSIALEAGRPQDAVSHFEAMVNMRRRSNANPRSMGEALCELAFA